MSQAKVRQAMGVLLWTVACLIAIDLFTNLATAFVKGHKGAQHTLVRYFDYGRAMEDKLVEVVKDPSHPGNAVFKAGWLDPLQWQMLPDRPAQAGGKLVAVYGQSFAFHLADLVAETEPRVSTRKIGGPGAPLNHSYAAYRLDASLRRADVVVVGILASSFCKIGTLSGMALSFEMPAPYTFPGYEFKHGQLVETWPVLKTEQAFRTALASRGADWEAFKQQYAQSDPTHDRFKFDASPLDQSMLVRLVRRGWVASRTAEWQSQRGSDGIQTCVHQALPTAVKLLEDWHAATRARGEDLVVVLLQDKGYTKVLTRTLLPALKQSGIKALDSADHIDSDDPGVFLPDGHFTPAAERGLAHALGGLLH